MRLKRLGTKERYLCLIGPGVVVFILVLAWVLIPFVWAHPLLRTLLARPCVLKATTGVPCPFCGATRAMVLAAHGEWIQSLLMNPLGVLLIGAGSLAGLWLGVCALSGKDLGLSAARRFLDRVGWGWLLLGSVAALWTYKIILDCVLGH